MSGRVADNMSTDAVLETTNSRSSISWRGREHDPGRERAVVFSRSGKSTPVYLVLFLLNRRDILKSEKVGRTWP